MTTQEVKRKPTAILSDVKGYSRLISENQYRMPSSQKSLLLVSILILLFPLITRAEDYQSLQPDSPYKKILESVKKGQETKTAQKPPQAQPPSSITKTQDQTPTPEKSKEKEVAIGLKAETWTLNVTSSLSSTSPVAGGTTSINIKASGTASLKIDPTGRLIGSGTMSVVETIAIPPNPAVQLAPATGQGRFTVIGKREGEYLFFSFDRGNIPLKGTMTVTTPAGSSTEPRSSSFDPSTAAPTPTTIDRKEGGTSTSQIKAGPVIGTTTFTLSGGTNVVKEAPPPKGIFPKEKNIWTLELQMKGNWEINTPEASGIGEFTYDGKVEFPLPLDDGPAKGEGPMTLNSSASWTKPRPVKGSQSSKAVLILDGRIENNILTFKPRSKMETAKITQGPPSFSASANFGEGLWIFDQAEQVSIPVKNGAEVIENISPSIPNMKYNGKAVWRLKGKKVEYWQVVIDQWNTLVFGDFKPGGGQTIKAGKSAQLVAGLKVHSRRIIDFVIEDDRYKNGNGTTSFVSIEPYSNPAGVYQCKPVASKIIGTGTEIEAERWDQVRNARRFNPKFMTKEDAELKKKWERIDEHKTPYIFPRSYSVNGTKTGQQVKLTLPEESGYTVAYHCTLDDNEAMKKVGYWKTRSPYSKRQEVLNEDRYLFNKTVEITLVDGWSNNRQFATKTDVETWFEVSLGNNTDNREVITVKRIKSQK